MDIERINKMTLQEIGREIRKEEQSPTECMEIMQKGFVEILYDIETDLVRGISDSRFYNRARETVRRTINDINADLEQKRKS